jgi:hypothetical protein
VIHLYIFFSKLERNLQDTFALEFKEWTAPDEISIKNVSWRSPDQTRKRRRTDAGDSAGDGNDDPADVGGLRDDSGWVGEGVQWRNRAVESGKEAMVISGEGEIPTHITSS